MAFVSDENRRRFVLRVLNTNAKRVAAATAIGLAAGAVGVLGAGQATADTQALATKDITYSCELPLIGTRDLVTTVSVNIPASGTVGTPIQATDFSASVHVPSEIVDFYRAFGGVTVSGTADAQSNINKNGAPFQTLDIPLTVPETPVPPTGELVVPGVGDVPPVTPDSAGTYAVHAGNFNSTLNVKDANGADIVISPMSVSCTAPADAGATHLGDVAVS
jgi:hypothetical protein